nr:hypothetical protein [Tanacetum cinerariifolium]
LALPSQVFTIQAKLKTLDALLSLLNKVIDTFNSPPRSSPQTEMERIKKDQGKATMSSMDNEEKETESDFENDDANPGDLMVESSKKKKLKRFDFVTEGGEHVYYTTEKIEEQERIEESLKAELAKQEVEKVKNDLVYLIGIDVVTKYYKNKLLYDNYCDKMLKRRKSSKITNCDILSRRGPITLNVYREDRIIKVIPYFKTDELGAYEPDECDQTNLNEQKGEGEGGPKWGIRSKFEDELGFMHEKKFHTKGIREMLDQHYSSQPTATNHTGRTIERGGSKSKEPNIRMKRSPDHPLSTIPLSRPVHDPHAKRNQGSKRPSFTQGKAQKDFVVLEMDEDELFLIILGRPFLATARAIIDVQEGKLNHMAKLIRERWVDTIDHDEEWIEAQEGRDSDEVQVVSFYLRAELVKSLEWKALENRLKPSSVEPPKLELKELPEHLEYAFL